MQGVDSMRPDATGVPCIPHRPITIGCVELRADALGHGEKLPSRLAETLLDTVAGQCQVKDQGFELRQVADIRIKDIPHRGWVPKNGRITEAPFSFSEEVSKEERLDVAELEELAHRRQAPHDGQF